MSETRVIFSPHTADPRFVAEVMAATAAAPLAVAAALWDVQIQVWQAMLAAQFNVLDTVLRASRRPA